jgi:hypothetical protein
MYGGGSYGTFPFGSVSTPIGVPIIVEVTLQTTELVLVVEIDVIQPQHEVEE